MAEDNRVLAGNRVIEQIASALGVDGRLCRRIVLDVAFGSPVQAYVEMFGSEKLLRVDWSGQLQNTNLVIMDKPKDDGNGA